MSWGLAADWAITAGSLCLTIGTGAQARANLAEYRSLTHRLPLAARQAIVTVAWALNDPYRPHVSKPWLLRQANLLLTAGLALRALLSGAGLFPLRGEDGELVGLTPGQAAELARVLRLAIVWSILMIGSALVLAGAVIQLVLGYTA